MRHASLFSGIGGFDLAASWMGWENILQCEIDLFCQKVLRYHFPSATIYGDIREFDGRPWKGRIDILTAGVPCQPASSAGRKRGTSDNRWLWPDALRVLREIQPPWFLFENVRGLASLEQGMVFDDLLAEMENMDYEVQAFCIPACAVGAPHRRDRFWILGHTKHDGLIATEDGKSGAQGSNSDSPKTNEVRKSSGSALSRPIAEGTKEPWSEPWIEAATKFCTLHDGLSDRLDGIAFPKWRRESIKAAGNSIIPQLAYLIFRSIPSHSL